MQRDLRHLLLRWRRGALQLIRAYPCRWPDDIFLKTHPYPAIKRAKLQCCIKIKGSYRDCDLGPAYNRSTARHEISNSARSLLGAS